MSDAPRWRELRVALPTLPSAIEVEGLVSAFDDAGSGAAIADGELVAYLPESTQTDRILVELRERIQPLAIRESVIEETNWAEAWKVYFKPRRVGKRIIVCPSWEQVDVGPDEILLELDPGQAFGTGDHPTTRLMLEFAEEYVRPGDRVFDVGCGSGILSVAALKLGALHVMAVDLDLPSVLATRANLERNHVEAGVAQAEGFSGLRGEADVVLTNIISATLVRLAPQAAAHVGPGGIWLTSGIIEANADAVRQAIAKAGLTLIEERSEGEWVAMAARR